MTPDDTNNDPTHQHPDQYTDALELPDQWEDDTPAARALARALIDELNQQDHEAAYLQREYETRDRLTAKFEALNTEIDRLRLEAQTLEAAAKRHPILSQIVAVLDGEITHAVFPDQPSYKPMIQTAAEAFTRLEGPDERRQSVRLVSLLPPNKGRSYSHQPGPGPWTASLGWYVNDWYDGSGTDYPVTLCRSLDEAHDVIRRLFAAAVTEFATAEPDARIRRDLTRWQRLADTGVDLHWPAHILEHFQTIAQQTRESALANARQVLDEILARPAPTGIDLPTPTNESSTPTHTIATTQGEPS